MILRSEVFLDARRAYALIWETLIRRQRRLVRDEVQQHATPTNSVCSPVCDAVSIPGASSSMARTLNTDPSMLRVDLVRVWKGDHATSEGRARDAAERFARFSRDKHERLNLLIVEYTMLEDREVAQPIPLCSRLCVLWTATKMTVNSLSQHGPSSPTIWISSSLTPRFCGSRSFMLISGALRSNIG